MSSARLSLHDPGGDAVTYTLEIEGSATQPVEAPRGALEKVAAEARELLSTAWLDGSQAAADLAAHVAKIALPEMLQRQIRRWAAAPGERTLLVRSAGDLAASLPWELVPAGLGLPRVTVARLLAGDLPEPARRASRGGVRSMPDPERLVIIGSPQYQGEALPGVAREVEEIEGRFSARLKVVSLIEPAAERLAQALSAGETRALHLSPAIARRDAVLLRDEATPAWLRASDLAKLTPLGAGPSLVVINAGGSGAETARAFCEALNAITVGWLGHVSDEGAAAFALFLYARLLEGLSPIEAVRAYLGRAASRARRAAWPVVWLPSAAGEAGAVFSPVTYAIDEVAYYRDGGTRSGGLESISNTTFDPHEPRAARPGAARGALGKAFAVSLKLPAALNPALLKNARPVIEQLTIESPELIKDARLEITCDTGSGSSTYRQTILLRAESNEIAVGDIHFPMLHELVRLGVGRRLINFTVSVSKGIEVCAQVTRSTQWRGATEWLDGPETWAFIPSFVIPESEGVQKLLGPAEEVLHNLGAPTDSFCGYQAPAKVGLQMKALFNTLRNKPYELTYVNPPASPVYLPGQRHAAGQIVRTPDEVLSNKRGTCHDLSLLFASSAEHMGIYPLVILIRKHTFFGFWQSQKAHGEHWERASRRTTRAAGFGGEWILDRARDLRDLVSAGSVVCVEATKVTNRNASWEEACEVGMARAQQTAEEDFDAAVDVWASRRAIQPLW